MHGCWAALFPSIPPHCDLTAAAHWVFRTRSYTKVTDDSLTHLRGRCGRITGLSLSWAGSFDGSRVTTPGLLDFLSVCWDHLRVLRLACCSFVDADCVAAIGKHCKRLTELDLQGVLCAGEAHEGFRAIARLSELQRLNLAMTHVCSDELEAIFSHCTRLQHVNIGHCTAADSPSILETLARHCPGLLSLDIWRLPGATTAGVVAIATECIDLMDLDMGWCLAVGTEAVLALAQNCPNLRKLFMTAHRASQLPLLREALDLLAVNCSGLEQLDLLNAPVSLPDAGHPPFIPSSLFPLLFVERRPSCPGPPPCLAASSPLTPRGTLALLTSRHTHSGQSQCPAGSSECLHDLGSLPQHAVSRRLILQAHRQRCDRRVDG